MVNTLGIKAKNLLGWRMTDCADKIGPNRPVRSYRGGRNVPFFCLGLCPFIYRASCPLIHAGNGGSVAVPRVKEVFEKLSLPARPRAAKRRGGERGAASGICARERKHGRRRSLFDCKQNVMVRVLYKNISFPKGAYFFVKSAVLKIMSNFVDTFAQTKPLYQVGVGRLRKSTPKRVRCAVYGGHCVQTSR